MYPPQCRVPAGTPHGFDLQYNIPDTRFLPKYQEATIGDEEIVEYEEEEEEEEIAE